MIRKRQISSSAPTVRTQPDDLHEWVLSLPWVVERSYNVGTPGVRSFAIDCEPLDRRRLWLVTGLQLGLPADSVGIAVIVPFETASAVEDAGWGQAVTQMPPQHVLVAVSDDVAVRGPDLEMLLLIAYSDAMS